MATISGTTASRDLGKVQHWSQGQKSAVLGLGVHCLGNSCFENSEIRRVILRSGLRMFSDRVFAKCKNLRHLELPEGLEEISEECFECSGLTSLHVPKSVRCIGEYAFHGCKDLR